MKLRFILLLCCCFLALFFIKSISFASAGIMVESNYKGTGSEIVDAIVEQYFNGGETENQSFLTTLSSIYSALNNDYASVNIYFSYGTGQYWNHYLNVAVANTQFIINNNNYTNITLTAPFTNYQLSNYRGSLTGSSTNQTRNSSIGLSTMNSQNIIVNLNSALSNKWWVNSTSSIDIDTLVALKYIPFNNNIQTIGGISNIHVENFSRSVYDWRIGTLQNFDNYTTGVLEMYQGNNNQWLPINNVMSWNSNGEVYLKNQNIYYYQLYRVSFYDRDYNYTNTYGYYFIPIGVTYSGDSLIYNGNDNNTNTPVINAISDVYSFNSGDVSSSFNKYFQSGDAILGLIGSSSIPSGDNLYYNFLYETFISITDTLKSSGNVTLNIDYRDFHMVLNSSDFYIPDSNPLKQFVKIALITGVIFLIYQQIDKMIRHLNNLQLAKSLHDTDVDYDVFL